MPSRRVPIMTTLKPSAMEAKSSNFFEVGVSSSHCFATVGS